MKRWTGALGILISVLFVISLSVTSHSIVTGLGAPAEVVAPGATELPPVAPEVTKEVAPEVIQEVAPLELPPGTERLPTDDAGVSEGNPNSTYGTLYNMYNGYVPGTFLSERDYLRFDLSDIDPAFLENAFLRANSKYGPSRAPGYTDTWHLVDAVPVRNDSWDETTITWNNAPPAEIDNVLDTENFKADGYWVGDNRAEDPDTGRYVWYLWDVTSYVKEELAGDKIVSICLRGQNENVYESGGWFYTRNSDTRKPHLYLVVENIRAVDIEADYPETRTGMPGGTLYFDNTIIVRNTGSTADNYDLSVSDNEGWGAGNLGVSPSSIELSAGESTLVTAWATIPPGTAPGIVNNITVTATSQTDNTVSDSDNWEANVAADRLGPTKDDSYVRDADNYFGVDYRDMNLNTTWMRVESYSGYEKNARMFLKWDLRGIPPENQIAKAELYIWCWVANYDDIDAQIYSVDDDSWLENELTWNNQPALVDVLDTVTLTAWPTSVVNSWISWDVTSYVAGQRLTDNTASFGVRAEVENTSGLYQFDGKDWWVVAEHPYLKITLGPDQPKVDVSISPVHRIGYPNDTVTYTVKVMNMGNVTDSYTLSTTDDEGWSTTLTPGSFANVPPGESRTATLSVALPGTQGAEDSIQVTATGTGVSNSENCTASVRRVGGWEVAGYAPRIDNYGVAVTGVGSGSYIYVANSNTLGTRVNFMRYDTDTGEWEYLATPWIATPFKNGTVLAWDNGDYIYALLGGSYADNAANQSARHYFFRYKISTNEWENLAPTGGTDDNTVDTGSQGAGDAMAIDTSANKIYAIVGNRVKGSTFWEYDIGTDTWTQLAMPSGWTSTDDGASLVWTGGDYLYALRGEWHETTPSQSFSRYSISDVEWVARANIPEQGGVGDGASLLWIGGDNIYATGGSMAKEAPPEPVDDNFYAYSISGNSWTQLEDLPAGIGEQNGPRLGAGSDIYAWRGSEDDPVLWTYTMAIPTIDWPMYGHDAANTGYSPSTAPTDNSVLWSKNISPSAPVVVNGRVYVGGSGGLYCLDGATGAEIWTFENGGSPAVVDGKVYFGSGDYFYSLNADNGDLIWKTKWRKLIEGTFVHHGNVYDGRMRFGSASYPTVADGRVYFGCYWEVIALDADTGEELWTQFNFDWVGGTHPTFAVADGKAYVVNWINISALTDVRTKIYAFDASTGDKLWEKTYAEALHSIGGSGHAPPTVVDGKIYARGGANVFAVNANNGDLIWRQGGYWARNRPLAIADGKLYYTTYFNRVLSRNADDGSLVWSKFGPTYNANLTGGASVAVADGKVYTSIVKEGYPTTYPEVSYLYSLDANNGSTIWSYRYVGREGVPVIADGRVYFNGGNTLYAFGSP